MEVDFTPKDYVYVTAESVVGLLTVVSNVLVLMVLKRYRVFHGSTSYFIGSLAVADVLVGILLTPVVILSYAGLPRDFHGCVFINSFVVMLSNVSVLNIVAIAIERYVAIVKFKLYLKIAKGRFAGGVILICWVFGIILGLIPNMGWHLGEETFAEQYKHRCSFMAVMDLWYMVSIVFFGLVIPSMILTLFVYVNILRVFRRKSRTNSVRADVEGHSSCRRRRNVQFKATRVLFRVIVVFIICWLPINIYNFIYVFFPGAIMPDDFRLFSIVLSHANSFMNPVIYAFSSTSFTQAVRGVVKGETPEAFQMLPHVSKTIGP